MTGNRILIVDDEQDIRELLRLAFERQGWVVQQAGDLASAETLLATGAQDVCITDMRLPDGSGIDLVKRMARLRPALPVIVITAYGSIETAVAALKAGAFDFVAKPIDTDVLRTIVQHAVRRSPRVEPKETLLVGESEAVRSLRDAISTAAASHAPVMIAGEPGTGRRRMAREIHRLASSEQRPLVAVDCAALPPESIVEAFFGGPTAQQVTGYPQGVLRAACGGTLYLGEVADLPSFMQVRLLRVLQERTIPASEADSSEIFDARIIASTGDPLEQIVHSGKLRHDLYYRLDVLELRLPPLRERSEDIPALAEFVRSQAARQSRRPLPALSRAALSRLSGYPFPGNFSELENIIMRAIVLARGDEVEPEHIQFPVVPAQGEVEGPAGRLDETDDGNLPQRLEANERAAILAALEKTHWNRTVAARLLGLSFRQLRYRIKKFGLDNAEN